MSESLKKLAGDIPMLYAAALLKVRTTVLEEVVKEAVMVANGLKICSHEYESDVGEAILKHFGLTDE